MFEKFKKTSKFDDAIDRVLVELTVYSPIDSEYVDLLERLERLQKLRSEELSGRVTGDTAIIAGANLLSIIAMIGYERAHVMTSKSLSMLLRTKLNS